MQDGGECGAWEEDETGLPVFVLRACTRDVDAWHQVGNDRVTATAHADGRVVFYWAEEGLLRIGELAPPAPFVTMRLGCGWAEWHWRDGALEGMRRLSAPFGDAPGWRIDVRLRGALPAMHVVHWRFAPHPIVGISLMSRYEPPPRGLDRRERFSWRAALAISAASRWITERLRDALALSLRLEARPLGDAEGLVLEPRGGACAPARPTWKARLPAPIFVAGFGTGRVRARGERHNAVTEVEIETDLDGAPEASFGVAVGLAPESEIGAALHTLREATPAASAAGWRSRFTLDLPADPALAREMRWHAMYLRSAQVRDAVLGTRYVPQGSAYSFLHGLQGAPRDYCLTAVALALIEPDVARETLRLCLRLVREDGSIAYAHTGAGHLTSAAVHRAPSDLPLFLLWGVSELVLATGDRSFLDEARPWLLRTFRWMRERVGCGPHGLLRVGSGDWNDPITAFAPDRRAFHRHGESSFNSAMAVHVLPLAAALLPDVEGEMHEFASRLRSALEASWNGAFFPRGFDGRGGAIGEDRLFLDANAWCLIARIGSDAQRARLVEEIDARCLRPSPIGPLILDRPAHVRGGILPPGWDTNGGVWAAISALTAWGLSLHDPERAFRCLRAQTLAAHARAYPNVWYGIWSAPDAWNAHHADRPGETFVQPATPMREFPVMNSNAHAGPLLALQRVLGLESTSNGASVVRASPASAGAWRLVTELGTWRGGDAAKRSD